MGIKSSTERSLTTNEKQVMQYMRDEFNEKSTNYLKLFLQGKEYRIREDKYSMFNPSCVGLLDVI